MVMPLKLLKCLKPNWSIYWVIFNLLMQDDF